jgi:hypothetical protein
VSLKLRLVGLLDIRATPRSLLPSSALFGLLKTEPVSIPLSGRQRPSPSFRADGLSSHTTPKEEKQIHIVAYMRDIEAAAI